MAMAYWPARLAEAYLLSGRREEGLAALEESFRHQEEIWWLPEQYRIRAELPDTVVVLLSTYTRDDLPADAASCGAARYVHKEDISPAVLLEVWQDR